MVTKDNFLLPVKMEAIGTSSSTESTELHSITMVTTQQAVMTDDIINLDTSNVANDNNKTSEC